MKQEMTGAEIVLQSLVDQGVEVVFGYPGGAVLPIYDTLFKQNSIKHVLVRQEVEQFMLLKVMHAQQVKLE